MPAPTVLFASKVAAFAGLHKHVDFQQAVLDQWYFQDPAGCSAACRQHGARPAPEDPDRVREYGLRLQEAVVAVDSAAMHAVLDAIPDAEVRDAVRHEASMARGTRDEASALDAIERLQGINVVGRNDTLFKKEALLPSGRRVKVMGRIDGRTGGEIVEVKNRMRKFFDVIPLYERVQVQLYLWMTGAETCKFVQCLDGQVRCEVIPRDPRFLDAVVWPEVDTSLDVLERALADDADERARLFQDGRLPMLHKGGVPW